MATESAERTYEETREDVEETLGFVPGYFDVLNEQVLVNEWPNFKRYAFEETAIPAKHRELIGLAVAANIKCPYCEAFHMEAARMHGATDEELAEISLLASWTARYSYSSLIHAQNYDVETFERELVQVADHIQREMASD